ncbi:MAG: hypothetical protein GY906_11975, partial [bacterium]|nr:hypothetical protein [bacterium]
VAARIGATTFNADGVVGVPPEFTGTTLTLSAKGPDMSAYAGLLGIDLPAESFAVAGRLIPEGNYITLEGVKARLGRNKGTIAGKIKAAVGFVGSDIRLNAEGPGLAWLEPITGLSDLPAQPYRVDGRLRVRSAGLQLDDVKVGLGDLSLRVGGFVASSPGFEGTKVSLQAHGPDISIPASLAGLSTLPRDSFRVSGTFSVTPNGYGLEGIDAALGDISAKANGIVGVGPELYGTRLNFEANGSRLSALDWIDDRVQLPGAPFSASGRIGIGPDGYRLEQVTAELAGHRVEADGTVVPKPDLIGSNMSVSIAGPDLGHAGRMVAETDLVELPALPEKPYTLTGNLRISDTGYELQTIDMTLGAAMGRLDGMIGRPPELLGTDITIDGDGPNASLFTALTGVSVPVTPFRFNGRIQRQDAGFRFEDLSVQLGEYHATIDGTLGEPPKLAGTDVLLHAEGPSLLLFEQLFDLPSLPHQPFRVDGRFNGDPRHFSGERIAVQIGESDVAGEFRLDLTGTPRLRAELESRRLDVAGYLARRAAQKREIAENEETQPAERRDRVIPDTPLELEVIRDANADVVWTVAELQMPIDRFHDITIDLALDDGRLQLGPMAATGSSGGVLNADLLLEPAGAAYKLTTNLTVEGGYLNLSGQRGNLSQRPEVDIYLQYSGAGASAHEL